VCTCALTLHSSYAHACCGTVNSVLVERIFVEGEAVILSFDKSYTSQVWVSVIVVSNLGLITTIAFFFHLEVFLKSFLL
jgi:hypothetical protein